MATLKKLKLTDAVWLFNHQNGEKVLAERRPAALVEEGYVYYLDCLVDCKDLTEPDDLDEDPIEEEQNPYEVVELTLTDVLALDSGEQELFHVGTTTPDELPEWDQEFYRVLLDGLEAYNPSDDAREAMQVRIERAFLTELVENFSKSTNTVQYAYASENTPDGLWGATLHSTRSKDEALSAWTQWLEDNDWFELVA